MRGGAVVRAAAGADAHQRPGRANDIVPGRSGSKSQIVRLLARCRKVWRVTPAVVLLSAQALITAHASYEVPTGGGAKAPGRSGEDIAKVGLIAAVPVDGGEVGLAWHSEENNRNDASRQR